MISAEDYLKRQRYLNNLCRGRYSLKLMRKQIRENLTEEVNIEYEGTNTFDDFNNLDSNVFEVVSNNSVEETDPNRYSLITKRKGNYDKWMIVAICDSDPFPSVPHFHGTGKYSNCKLDPYTGLVYNGRKVVGKEKKWYSKRDVERRWIPKNCNRSY
ncbi:hypothetical protein CN383_14180 [Priestia megaterium]|uniref:hypothetical protein n=1 Tax=Priestia megaterium TaxID=1404 RepID=UPI000BF666F7|nr:hypothetical protein [Priestia megaterium]PFA99871.1 hypothetical protein CN383_14180 [Priestia megaterium]